MKKFFVNFSTIIIILIIDILLSTYLSFYGMKVNPWLVYVVFISLFIGHMEAVVLGFLLGMILDILHLKLFGLNTLVLMTTGYLCGWLYKRVNETLFKVRVLLLLVSSIIYLLLTIIISELFSISYTLTPKIFLVPFINTLFGLLFIEFFIWYYKRNDII